jgi:hypothetical protein
MQTGARELWWAAAAIAAITILYLMVASHLQAVPAAGDLFGHSLGIIGFLLMLATEILYSLRKRSRRARWGPAASWLRFHIFTGVFGAYLVLLHTSWKFNQLAGVVVILTVVVVASGFIGRYIYSAVPRTADGTALAREQLETEIATVGAELQARLAQSPEASKALALPLTSPSDSPQDPTYMVLGRPLIELRYRWQWRREMARQDVAVREQAAQLEKLVARQRQLQRQMASLAMTRRLLGIWHSVHIPLGLALFTAAFVHIGAALYYASFLH